MRTLPLGERLGEFRVESMVEAVPEGTVYAARQDPLGRSVRLYVAESAPGTPDGERFLRRARALAGVADARVASVIGASVAEGRPYAATVELDGPRLDDVLRGGPLSVDRALAIGCDVAEALVALEEQGVVLAAVPARAVHLIGAEGRERAVVAPLELEFGDAAGSGGRALAALLAAMLGNAPPDRLTPLLSAPPASPVALVDAAMAACGQRRRRIPVVAGMALVAVGAAVALIAPGSGTREASTSAGRVATTVPLGVQPTSVAVGEGAVWVGAVDGTVLRIDPRTRTVTGAPIRVSGRVEDSTVRAGEGGVFVLTGRSVHRIDPVRRRVTHRVRMAQPVIGATVADGALWVTGTASPGKDPDVVPLDPDTLEASGRPVPASLVAQDVDAGDGAVWTASTVDGTVTRADAATGDRRLLRAGVSAYAGALGHGAYWVPDDFGQILARIDARTGRLDRRVVRFGASAIAATASTDAVWVMTLSGLARDAPGRLHRVDPATMREVGEPVPLGPGPGWPVAGDGVIWVYSRPQRALLAIEPTRPAPTARPAARQVRELRPGPLPPGRLTERRFAAPFEIELRGDDWLGLAGSRNETAAALTYEPRASLMFMMVNQAFRSENDATRATTEAEVLQALRRHLSLRIDSVRSTTLAGRPATRIDARVRPARRWPDFCPRACAPVVGTTAAVVLGLSGELVRVYLQRHAAGLVAVALVAPRGESSVRRLEAAVASLRFLP